MLAGDRLGKRLNRIYKEDLGEEEILQELEYFLGEYSENRNEGEHFGDFVLRTHFKD